MKPYSTLDFFDDEDINSNKLTVSTDESDSPPVQHTKIDPRKLLDDIYDVYLVDLPSNFEEALLRA